MQVLDEPDWQGGSVKDLVTMIDVPDSGTRQEWTQTYRDLLAQRRSPGLLDQEGHHLADALDFHSELVTIFPKTVLTTSTGNLAEAKYWMVLDCDHLGRNRCGADDAVRSLGTGGRLTDMQQDITG